MARRIPTDSEAKTGDFPIACLGGSAGGLRPYMEVIHEIPPDAGIAVVVINHSRGRNSKLPQILAGSTLMPVELIVSGMKPRPNRVYIIPPNCDVTLQDREFHLSPLTKESGWPTVVTVFLESLAREWKGPVIAAILSGLDSDGADALRAVKAA